MNKNIEIIDDRQTEGEIKIKFNFLVMRQDEDEYFNRLGKVIHDLNNEYCFNSIIEIDIDDKKQQLYNYTNDNEALM